MPAKRIQVSDDDATYYTLPGNSGELRNEAGQLADTIFGQLFESNETGLISATLSSNAIYKGFAGYIVSLKKSGVSTAMVGEATTNVSGKIYQITAAAKRILDVEQSIVVKDNGVDETANVISINYLTGTVEFDAGYTVTGPVVIDANYFPMTDIAGAKTFNLTQTANTIDETDIPTAKANDGWRVFSGGLKTVSLELSGIFKATNGFRTALVDREPIYVEINPDNSGLSVFRGIFKYSSQGQAGDVGALEEETVNLTLNVPDDDEGLFEAPASWDHNALTRLNMGVQKLLTAWDEGSAVYVKYLPDGTNGHKQQGIVTDISLAGGLESMNEFTVNLQLSGAPTDVP